MVSRKTSKKIDLENFRSESFSIRTSEGRAPASELVLQKEACLPRSLQLDFLISPAKLDFFLLVIKRPATAGLLISVSRGRCGLRKTGKIFSANNEQGTIKRGEKWFPEKL